MSTTIAPQQEQTREGLNLVLNATELMELLESSVRSRTYVMVWGKPGGGKTKLAHTLALRTNRELVSFDASMREPVDLVGIPYRDEDNFTDFALARLVARLDRPNGVIWNLDDLTRGTTQMQSALLNALWTGRIGDFYLPENCWIMASSNDLSSRGVSNPSDAVMGRFTHVRLEQTGQDWTTWAVQAKIHPLIVRYIRNNPDSLWASPAEKLELAQASPRQWERLSNILYEFDANPVSERATWVSIAGTVGVPNAVQVVSYRSLFKELPPVDHIFSAPDKAKVPPDSRPDALYAVACVVARYMNEENASQASMYLNRLPEEYRVAAWHDATTRDSSLVDTPEYTEFKVKHQHIHLGAQ